MIDDNLFRRFVHKKTDDKIQAILYKKYLPPMEPIILDWLHRSSYIKATTGKECLIVKDKRLSYGTMIVKNITKGTVYSMPPQEFFDTHEVGHSPYVDISRYGEVDTDRVRKKY